MLPKIFQGVRVLDFSRLLPGPFASDLLIRLGAKVTCVQPPGTDPLLGVYTPFIKLRSGKKFLTLDLKTAVGKKRALALVQKSDILLEGFRPGSLARLGLGFEKVRAKNPKILYVSLVGYPQGHSKFLRGAHDLNFLVDAGVYSLLYPDGSDVIPALQLADVFGGFYAAFRILVAWIQRVKMPQALHLTVPLTEGLERLTDYLQHESSVPLLPSLTGALARYRVYWTKDRKRIAVAALESKFFANFLEVLEIRGMERKNERDLAWQIQKRIGKKNLAEWKRIFREADACVSFIPSREEALKGSSKKYLRDPI